MKYNFVSVFSELEAAGKKEHNLIYSYVHVVPSPKRRPLIHYAEVKGSSIHTVKTDWLK